MKCNTAIIDQNMLKSCEEMPDNRIALSGSFIRCQSVHAFRGVCRVKDISHPLDSIRRWKSNNQACQQRTCEWQTCGEVGKQGRYVFAVPKGGVIMKEFPDFMKNQLNHIDSTQQNTSDIDGYYYEGADGCQICF